MKNKLLYILLFFIVSCNYLDDITPPEIEQIVPTNGSVTDVRPSIEITFSKSMDKAKTEEAFTITGDHQPKGYFSWNDKTLIFNLFEDLHEATIYTIHIRSSAEDTRGNNLLRDYSSTFSVGSDLIKPYVISIQPSDGQYISDLVQPIVVHFSEPVRLDTYKKGFLLSPYVIGDFRLDNEGTTCIFTPYDSYLHGTTYTITLTTDIKDTAGNSLVKEYKSIFKAGIDFIAPTLNPDSVTPPDSTVGVFAQNISNSFRLLPYTTTEGVDKDATFIITFSKSMQRYDTEKSISISPPFEFISSWLNDRSLHIMPSSPLQLMDTYTISITTQAKDIAGNSLDTSYNFPFKVFSELSQPIEVIPYGNTIKHIYLLECDDINDEPTEPNNSIILYNDDIINPDSPYSFTKEINGVNCQCIILRVQFDNSSHTLSSIGHIALPSAMQSVSISSIINQPGMLPLKILKIQVHQDHPDCIDVYIFNQEQVLPGGVYFKLSIRNGLDGIKDSHGNYMLTPFAIYLNM